ncbi:MAG: haloalkane dehalogenase [Polyangiaceae bacterium]
MRVLRTPDARFASLPEYPFAPHYLEVEPGLRMHYVDEPALSQGATPSLATLGPVLMLHGEPSWSYLYRKMIPVFTAAGLRAIAPDLIGFGKSDKPVSKRDYTYARHVAWMTKLVTELDLRDVTLICQDWGSLIGLRVAAEQESRFGRIVVANGFLPTADRPVPAAFRAWAAFAKYSPLFPIGRVVTSGCVTKPPPEVRAAYDAPFPSSEYTAGARVFPSLVPTTESDPAIPANRAAWAVLGKWEKPFLTLFGKNDPILGRADRALQSHVPGARDQPHERFWGGHFVQEDRGLYLAQRVVAWLRALSA